MNKKMRILVTGLLVIFSSLTFSSDSGAVIYKEKSVLISDEIRTEIISGKREAIQRVSTIFSYYKNNIYQYLRLAIRNAQYIDIEYNELIEDFSKIYNNELQTKKEE